MQDKYKFLIMGALSAGCLAMGSASAAEQVKIPGWQNAVPDGKDTPTIDPMILYSSGGVDGKMAVIGIPSFKTYRHIDCGVDTHEISFGGSNKGNKNGTPAAEFFYLSHQGAIPVCKCHQPPGDLYRI